MGPSDLKRAARYMGAPLTDDTRALLLKAADKAAPFFNPRHVVRRVRFNRAEQGVWADELLLPGQAIQRHLSGCREGYLLAITLGTQADTAIQRESLLSKAMGMAASALASVAVEEALDALCQSLEGPLTPRFSPGYGDLPLAVQPAFLQAVKARSIGLYLTESFMMAPEKSVTAIVGITDDPTAACINRCAQCGNAACPYREE